MTLVYIIFILICILLTLSIVFGIILYKQIKERLNSYDDDFTEFIEFVCLKLFYIRNIKKISNMTREEAIKEIKSWAIPSARGREVLETLIPELVESEDERIRKELIEFIQWSVDRHFMREDFHQAKRPSEWIDYLEKQKENTWSEEDDAKVKVMCEEGNLKPSERTWLKDLRNRVWKEQKPVEWSKEDERILKGIIGKIDHDQTYGVSKAEMLSFLKSLRPDSYKNCNSRWKPPQRSRWKHLIPFFVLEI